MDLEGVDTGNVSKNEDESKFKGSSSSITSSSSSDAGPRWLAEAANKVLPAGAGLAKDFEDTPPLNAAPPSKPPVPPNAGAALVVLPNPKLGVDPVLP
jgi:hypothetical protein